MHDSKACGSKVNGSFCRVHTVLHECAKKVLFDRMVT
jgi:hypothetical protein